LLERKELRPRAGLACQGYRQLLENLLSGYRLLELLDPSRKLVFLSCRFIARRHLDGDFFFGLTGEFRKLSSQTL
jgi:hypothetical protein